MVHKNKDNLTAFLEKSKHNKNRYGIKKGKYELLYRYFTHHFERQVYQTLRKYRNFLIDQRYSHLYTVNLSIYVDYQKYIKAKHHYDHSVLLATRLHVSLLNFFNL